MKLWLAERTLRKHSYLIEPMTSGDAIDSQIMETTRCTVEIDDI
jgi:hypothetical protein